MSKFYGGTDWEGVAMFVIIFVVVLGMFGSLGYAIVSETNSDNDRAKQCIAAGKDWVDGNCLSTVRTDRD